MSEPLPTDAELLQEYAAGAEAAFRVVVNRHIGLVHATARRVLSTAPHLADDVTQAVFTDLARKAATLAPEVVLAGWLHRHSYYLALNAARAEHRRQARERTAMEINAANETAAPVEPWQQLAPVLDDALNRLDPPDRDALVLRFLEQQDLRSVGRALGTSEDTAQKRVSRALEKLRNIFGQRGITLSATALAASLDAGTVATTPAEFAATVSTVAMSSATTVAGISLIYLTTMTLTQKATVAVAILVIAGLSITLVLQKRTSPTNTPTIPKTSATISPSPAKQAVTAQVEAPKMAPVVPKQGFPTLPDALAKALPETAHYADGNTTYESIKLPNGTLFQAVIHRNANGTTTMTEANGFSMTTSASMGGGGPMDAQMIENDDGTMTYITVDGTIRKMHNKLVLPSVPSDNQ